MTDGFIFHGEVHQVDKDPDWIKPRPLPHEGYRGYEVFIHMWHYALYHSDYLIPTTVVPINRNPAHNPPMRVKLTLGNDTLTNTKYFQLYNPAMKKSYNCNRMFITIANTMLIYHSKLQLHWNLDITAHAVPPSRISEDSIRGWGGQRSREAVFAMGYVRWQTNNAYYWK